jgi:hypothetical protein
MVFLTLSSFANFAFVWPTGTRKDNTGRIQADEDSEETREAETTGNVDNGQQVLRSWTRVGKTYGPMRTMGNTEQMIYGPARSMDEGSQSEPKYELTVNACRVILHGKELTLIHLAFQATPKGPNHC